MRTSTGLWNIPVLVLAVFLFSACKPKPANSKPMGLNRSAVELALQKSGGPQQVENEVDVLFTRFGDARLKILYDSELTNSLALKQFASSLKGEIIGISPSGVDQIGIPAYLSIRFGTHQHYQFVKVFPKGVSVPLNTGLIHITNNIFLDP